MSEIQEAVQIIRVGYDGVEIVMKVGSASLNTMKKAIDFLVALLEREKTLGKTSMKKLLLKGGDLQVFQFNTEEIKKVEKMAKKYGILYSILPDINKEDGKCEIIFHSEGVPRVNMMIQKLNFGRIATFDDYLKDGNEQEIDKILKFLKNQQMGNERVHTEESMRASVLMEGLIEKVGFYAVEKQVINADAIKEQFCVDGKQAEDVIKHLETIGLLDKGDAQGNHRVTMDKQGFENRLKGYQRLTDRMNAISASKNINMVDITISKKMISEENDHAVKTFIPGGKGKFLWISKENAMDIHDGKTILTFLDKEKEYKIYSSDNRVLEMIKGANLYEIHYDPVNAKIRDELAKAQTESRTKIMKNVAISNNSSAKKR
jgi:hypothetical protein